jgi:hypothetical protein
MKRKCSFESPIEECGDLLVLRRFPGGRPYPVCDVHMKQFVQYENCTKPITIDEHETLEIIEE